MIIELVRDGTTDIKIFAVSLLLSTILVYNNFGLIDEQALKNLSLVVRMIELIKVSKKDSTTKSKRALYQELSKYFPYFIWSLRDFSLNLGDKTAE